MDESKSRAVDHRTCLRYPSSRRQMELVEPLIPQAGAADKRTVILREV